MNPTYYNLPTPETIRKYTVSVKASASTTSKWKLKNLESGMTLNGAPRKMEFRVRRKVT